MTLDQYLLLGLAKDCIEYIRAHRRVDLESETNNHNQIIHQCAKIAGVPLTVPKSTKNDHIDDTVIINNATEGERHTILDVRYNIPDTDAEYLCHCDHCGMIIFVDEQNEWAYTLEFSNGTFDLLSGKDGLGLVKGCHA